jgi:2-polyprenyl-6-methoxyphenol hydroxylase-like FAD-dependent oxidoreductase
MHDADDFYFDSMSLVEMPQWSRGRVALLGDAAFCASPASSQGTGMALVGAYTLAGELSELSTGDDPVTALAAYETLMRPYVKVNQDFAHQAVKSFTARTRGQLRMRNAMMRMLPYMPWKNLIAASITKQLQHAANHVKLKSYR